MSVLLLLPLVCPPGMWSPGNTACVNCAPGRYGHGCAPCPAHTTSPAGAERAHECVPMAGFYGRAEVRECPADHFCPMGATDPTPCPRGLVAGPGSGTCLVRRASLPSGLWPALAVLAVLFTRAVLR